MSSATHHCAVLGSPIAHSLSPAMHRAAYRELGLNDWSYEAVEVDEAGLADFLDGLDDSWVGLSLTMPLKRAVISLADEVSKVANTLQIANTLELRAGRRTASNTDCAGAMGALAEREVRTINSVRVLGGGATAASIVYAMTRTHRPSVEFVVRDESRAAAAASFARQAGCEVSVRQFDRPLLAVVDLLVSTVPSSAVRGTAHELVDSARAVLDVVYDPWPTALGQAAAKHSRTYVSGIDMLAHQAAFQVELFTGRPVEPALLREAAIVELSGR